MAVVSHGSNVVIDNLRRGPVLLIYSFMPAVQGRAADPDEPELEDLLAEPTFDEAVSAVQFVPVLQIGSVRHYHGGVIGLGEEYLKAVCELVPTVGVTPVRRVSVVIQEDGYGNNAVTLVGNLGTTVEGELYRVVDNTKHPLRYDVFERQLEMTENVSELLHKIVELCVRASNPQDLGRLEDLEDPHRVNGVGNNSSNREDSEEDVNTLAIPRGPLWWLEEMLDQVADWWSGKMDDDSDDSELEAA
jgi:hypothetical protein